ncbi:hypothetical protein GCM10023214_21250 [Amycolatopsis dongchuanensis]|uniref:Uncharacterized protein n=1 Tax=Amycolatopsis dongchuanensis TaxID=1070866 RepID=A0ABP9Q9R2_9PSEU
MSDGGTSSQGLSLYEASAGSGLLTFGAVGAEVAEVAGGSGDPPVLSVQAAASARTEAATASKRSPLDLIVRPSSPEKSTRPAPTTVTV